MRITNKPIDWSYKRGAVIPWYMSRASFLYIMCQSGWSSLIAASCNGHVEVVEKLIQNGATVDLLHEV